jgi:hypothetical protein
VLVHDGDLRCDVLEVGPEPMVVTGSLHVAGLLTDGKGADHTLLVVLGDLEAHSLLTVSAVFVAGEVRLKGVAFGDSLGDEVFDAGALTARAVIESGHHFVVAGALDVGVLVGTHLTAPAPPRATRQPHEALAKGVYKIEERADGEVTDSSVDSAALRKRLIAGKPVLAEGTEADPTERAIAALKGKAARGQKATRLTLESKHLRALPRSLFELSWLESLNLNHNDPPVIPPEMGTLLSLKRLELESWPIETIPDSVCRLPSLKVLSLRYCKQLRTLPAAFANLVSLEELFLDAGGLAAFPEVLLALPKLKKLWWWGFWGEPVKKVAQLIEGTGRLSRLTHSGFFQGHVQGFPESLTALARLKQFSLKLDKVANADVAKFKAVLGDRLLLPSR